MNSRLGEGSKFEFTSGRGVKDAALGSLGPFFGADNGKIYRRRSVACHKTARLHNPALRVSFTFGEFVWQKTSVKQ